MRQCLYFHSAATLRDTGPNRKFQQDQFTFQKGRTLSAKFANARSWSVIILALAVAIGFSVWLGLGRARCSHTLRGRFMRALNQRIELSLRRDWAWHQIVKYLTHKATPPPYQRPTTAVTDRSTIRSKHTTRQSFADKHMARLIRRCSARFKPP